MHGRGCSHDMGAGRNFWVSGRTIAGHPPELAEPGMLLDVPPRFMWGWGHNVSA